ncbi:MAG TPA: hypothetical protein VGI73_07120 [Solirubrobacterales bacterium]
MLVLLLLLVSAGWPAFAAPKDAKASPLSVVNIGGRTYLTGNLATLANRLVKTPAMRFILVAVEQCRGAQVRGFVGRSGVGLTAYFPLSIAGCFESPNGGPGGGPGGPCLQGFETPLSPDPTGVAGLPGGQPRSYVMFAGSSARVCEDISTQVPGGVWARTGASIPGLPAGSLALVKCQLATASALWDYLGQPTQTLPASKATYWLNDYYFQSGSTERLAGVPSCLGVEVALP